MITINQYLECLENGVIVPYCEAMRTIQQQLGFDTMADFAGALGCNPRTLENYRYGRTETPPIMLLGKIKRMMED
jgi:hypothetical protein